MNYDGVFTWDSWGFIVTLCVVIAYTGECTCPACVVNVAIPVVGRGTAILVMFPLVVATLTAGARTADVVSVRVTPASGVCDTDGRFRTVAMLGRAAVVEGADGVVTTACICDCATLTPGDVGVILTVTTPVLVMPSGRATILGVEFVCGAIVCKPKTDCGVVTLTLSVLVVRTGMISGSDTMMMAGVVAGNGLNVGMSLVGWESATVDPASSWLVFSLAPKNKQGTISNRKKMG